MRRPVALLVALLAAGAERAAAQTDGVDSLVVLEMRRQRVPGLSLAVLRHGQLVKAEGYGVADVASGAFVSTVLDLARWDAALHTDSVLADSTRRRMWAPTALADDTPHPYGLGWHPGWLDGHRLVHHGGGLAGFRAWFARFVDDGLTVIVLMNLDDVDPVTIVNGVARLYLPRVAPGDAR